MAEHGETPISKGDAVHYASHSYEDPAEGLTAMIADAVLTLGRAAQSLVDDPQVVHDLVELAETSGVVPRFAELSETAAAHGKSFGPDLVLALVGLDLELWESGGVVALSEATTVDLDQFPRQPKADEAFAQQLQLLLLSCEGLANAHIEYIRTRDFDGDAVTHSLIALGASLDAIDSGVAVACALTATNLAGHASALHAAECLISTATGFDENWARYGIAVRAKALAALDQSSRVDVFDAVETACRFAPEPSEIRGPVATLLATVITSNDYLAPLAGLWVLAFQDVTSDPELMASRPYASLLWHVDYETVIKSISALSSVASTIETDRLGLLPPSMEEAARADWNNWSIDHIAYRRAIPFGHSILREAALSEILLTLQHEITHIDSAYSELGQHLLALRCAIVNREIQLWDYAGTQVGVDVMLSVGPAPLAGGNIYALGLAEQALELARKAQLLRAIWLPWLEGVAVYGELAADPTKEEEATYRPGEVLAALIDETASLRAEQEGVSLQEAARMMIADADARYGSALREVGRQRLRTYLDTHTNRYLPGYLAVRAVVSAWRRKRPLTGVRAANILLSATQAGTQGAVPDLGLPLDQFERRAYELLLEWIDTISGLNEASLEALDGHPATWVRGDDRELIASRNVDDESLKPLDEQRIADLADEASVWRTGRGNDFRDEPITAELIERVTLRHAAQTSTAGDLTEVLTYAIGPQQALMPIGEVTAPFWISVDTSHLICAVRITETTRDTGAPGYTCYVTPLEEDELTDMVDAVGKLRESRLTIGRFADMVPYHPETRPDRGVGRNVIGLHYGDVTIVRQAGQFTGMEASPEFVYEVSQRMAPHPLVGFEHTLANGRDAAARTANWIEDQDAWTQDTGEPIPGEPWRERVLELARIVEADDDAVLVREAGERILVSLGWPPGLYEDVCTQGLRGLSPDEDLDLTALLQAMMDTAGAPAAIELANFPPAVAGLLFAQARGKIDLKPWKPANIGSVE